MDERFPNIGFFKKVYASAAPWDIGAAQPALVRVIEELPPGGCVLDLGCGTGDLAIALARAGHRVIGLDFAKAAIEMAIQRSADLPVEQRVRIDFRLGDALHPSTFAGQIAAITDCGFFHLFDADTRDTLVRELATALPIGGRYYMLAFTVDFATDDAPRPVTPEELERRFSRRAGWTIEASRAAEFQTTGFGAVPAWVMCAKRTIG